MASEEDLRVAREITCSIRYLREKGRGLLLTSIVTAITAARAETWKEAIEIVQGVSIGYYNPRTAAAFKDALLAKLEAAAGSKTKVFSEDEKKNQGR